MSEHTDATEDRPGDDDVEQAREDREQLGQTETETETETEADQPQPWAKALPGDTD
jgi:hypothetical protein